MKDERDLRERTQIFARRIIRLFLALAKDAASQILGKQVLRAGTSIGANYREASRARSKAEFASKIGECLKEADETLYWLELLRDEGFVPGTRLQPLIQEANELVAILTTIHKKSRSSP
jgi:four helix bundle protein